jgi:hypothetical protein
MNTQRTAPHETISDDEVGSELARAALGAGAAWARYGLTIASATLDAGASSLKATAGLLGLLSQKISESFEQAANRDQP